MKYMLFKDILLFSSIMFFMDVWINNFQHVVSESWFGTHKDYSGYKIKIYSLYSLFVIKSIWVKPWSDTWKLFVHTFKKNIIEYNSTSSVVHYVPPFFILVHPLLIVSLHFYYFWLWTSHSINSIYSHFIRLTWSTIKKDSRTTNILNSLSFTFLKIRHLLGDGDNTIICIIRSKTYLDDPYRKRSGKKKTSLNSLWLNYATPRTRLRFFSLIMRRIEMAKCDT